MDKIRKGLRSDEGFTLVELMVVVLIIAILMAIAIPTFLGARQKAQDRAAQSNLRNGLTAAKVYYVDSETYPDQTVALQLAALQALEPSITFAAAPSATNSAEVGVSTCDVGAAAQKAIAMQSISASGTTFTILDVTAGASAGTWYADTAQACVDDPAEGATWTKTGF